MTWDVKERRKIQLQQHHRVIIEETEIKILKSASDSAGPEFDPRRGGDVHFLIARLYNTGLD